MKYYLILLVGIVYLTCSVFYIRHEQKVSVLREQGITTPIKRVKRYTKDHSSYYFDYYTEIKNDERYWIGGGSNMKFFETDKRMYKGKNAVYLADDPLVFMTEDELAKNEVSLYFINMFIGFYALGFLVVFIFIPKKRKAKKYHLPSV